MLAEGHLGGPPDILGQRGNQGFHHDHDHVVVGVCFVALKHGELGVVAGGEALVAEHTGEFEHPLDAADQEPLEVELGRDAQKELHVQRLVVGGEGLGVGAAVQRMQDRGLDFDETAGQQFPPNCLGQSASPQEPGADLFVGEEVHIPQSSPQLGIFQPFSLLGRVVERLGEQKDGISIHRGFALVGGLEFPLHEEKVPSIELAQQREIALGKAVLLKADLDAAASVHQV